MELIWNGKYDDQGRRAEPSRTTFPLEVREIYDPPAQSEGSTVNDVASADFWRNRLIHADATRALASLLPRFAGKVRLVYIDPPFATGGVYFQETRVGERSFRRRAFADPAGDRLDGYLQWLSGILILLRELLSDDGTLYLHLDWRAAAAVRIAADEIFGATARNQVIWAYGGRGAKAVAKQFPRNHDELLVYSRTPRPFYRPVYREVRAPFSEATSRGFRIDSDGRPYKTAPRGDYTDQSLERLRSEGRVHVTRNGKMRVKYFLARADGCILERKLVGDVWDDIPDAMHLPAAERYSYPTQKPIRLLERILGATTATDDLVLDCFGGSGVTAAAASGMRDESGNLAPRRWILIDSGLPAIQTTLRRLATTPAGAPFQVEAMSGRPAEVSAPSARPSGSFAPLIQVRRKSEQVVVHIESAVGGPPLLFWALDSQFVGGAFCAGPRSALRPGSNGSIDSTLCYRRPDAHLLAVRWLDASGGEGIEVVPAPGVESL